MLATGLALLASCSSPAERLAKNLEGRWEVPLPADIQGEVAKGRDVIVGESVVFRPADSTVTFRSLSGTIEGKYRVVDSVFVAVRFTGGLAGFLLGQRTLQARLSEDRDTLYLTPSAFRPGMATYVRAGGGA